MQVIRYAYAAVAFAFILAVAWQVFLAGLALFGGGQWATHVDFGYLVGAIPLLLIVGAWLSRADRNEILLAAGTLVVAQVQTFLPLAQESIPWVAALHPVNAMVVFWLAALVARHAFTLARATDGAQPASATAAEEA